MAKKRQSGKGLGEKHSHHIYKYPETGNYQGICRGKKRRFDAADILKAGGWRETKSEGTVWCRAYRGFRLW